jgi:serine/threonine protein kinase/beta-lactam-binding protein with PASTA domain
VPHAQPLKTGDPLRLGDYELTARLGEGGQGVVFLGTRPEPDAERYAVKLLYASVGEDEAAFLREANLAKQVARFCTAQVVDAGVEEGRPFIVSEYVDGPSLQRDVALAGSRSGSALERLAIGMATALAAIHQAGIVHRDFKPQNVLLGPDGPRVIDFGLARALDAAATMSGRGAGTPAYMAPEQISAGEITAAVDVFAWAGTICFAANGKAPFGQDSIPAVMHRILTARPVIGDIGGQLGLLVERCLAKDPADRPTSRELLLALLGDTSSQLVTPLTRPSAPAPTTPEAPEAPEPSAPGFTTPEPTALGPTAPERSVPAEPGSEVAATTGDQAGPAYHLSSAERARADEPALETGMIQSLSSTSAAGEPVRETEGMRTNPGRAGRASMAVSGSLLVSAAVLVAVLVPTLTSGTERPGGVEVARPPATGEGIVGTPVEEGRTEPVVPPTRAEPEPGVTSGRATVLVPDLVGLDRSAALSAIKRAGLVAGQITEADSAEPIGRVLAAEPASGATVAKGSSVALRVSAGVEVPALIGLGRTAAEAALTTAGLTVGEVSRICSDLPAGQVIESRPGAGSRAGAGSAVSLVVARQGAVVPGVVGSAQADAQQAIRAAGLGVRVRGRIVDSPAQAGVVLAQTPGPEVCARPGGIVTITVGIEGTSNPEPEDPPGSVTPSADPDTRTETET